MSNPNKIKNIINDQRLKSYKLKKLLFALLILISQTLLLFGFGKLTLISIMKSIDEYVLNGFIKFFQSEPRIVSIVEILTDLGKTQYNYYLAAALAIYSSIKFKSIYPGIIIFSSGYLIVLYQKLMIKLVDGSIPSENVIGTAGPFFSGGVARVVLLSGLILLTASKFKTKTVCTVALAIGLFEGVTRLVLGRHWPLDVIGGMAAGIIVLSFTTKVLEPWLHAHTRTSAGRS